VLNGSDHVRPTTSAKVHAAMEALGYSPTRSAAGSRGPRQGFVGVLVPYFDEPSSYQRLRGIVRALQPHGLEIVLYNVDAPDRARRRLVEVPRHQLDGLIILSLPLRADEGERLARAHFPTVLVDTSHPALPSVVVDDREGGRMATDYLLSLGHERIAFIGEPERNPFGFVSSRNREAGVAGALAAAGVAFERRYVKYGPHLRTAAQRLAAELFAMPEPPTAVVAASDLQALGVSEAASSRRQAVPRDVSVIGYDDIHPRRIQRRRPDAPAAQASQQCGSRSDRCAPRPAAGPPRSSRSWRSSSSFAPRREGPPTTSTNGQNVVVGGRR
jgi:DNA-binding LacI/PurR family transcriptional regulator